MRAIPIIACAFVVLGTGVRSVELGRELALSPGLYFVRLRQGAALRMARAVVER